VAIEHQELLPQLLVNVVVVLHGQIITMERISALSTGIDLMNEPILHRIIPTVEVLMM
tara:strand:- start:660 stop:833 length:174 start_codon:yes stop_codon:yes gene_type:complete